jgi:hypothetical protein
MRVKNKNQKMQKEDYESVPVVETARVTRDPHMWHCCLWGGSDRRALRFCMTALLSSTLMLFSCGMIALADLSCAEQNTFVAMITLTIGYWLKSPLDN